MIRYSCLRKRSRRGGLLGGLIVCLILVGIVGAIGYKVFYSSSSRFSQGDLITQNVSRGPFDHIVLEQGEIESSSNQEVICEVRSRGGSGVAILWVIDEGAKVDKGEKLVELDSSELELSLKEQKIQVITAEARAASAAALVKQAEISRQEYLEGVYKSEEKRLRSEIAIAEQLKRKAELALESSGRLVAKGLIKSLQLEADTFAVANAKNQLEAAEGNLWVLENLTREKMLVQYDSDIDAARAALSAAESELMEERSELEEITEQIRKCVLLAPGAGVVVHANRYSSRGGSAEFVVEAGATVRERQAIIRLPDPSLMQVKCKINESRITLIREGMPARISVDAIPGMKLTGRVKKVNRYAEPSSFFSSSIKEYATIIEIINPPENIRTGMTAETQIFVEQLEDATQIPIQGLYEHGNEMYSLVQLSADKFETRKVTIGATNDTMASIDQGLGEGDKVVLNLREHLSLMDLPDVVREDNSAMRELGAARDVGAVAPDNAVGFDAGSMGPGGPRGGPGDPGGGRRGGGRAGGGEGGGPSGGEGGWQGEAGGQRGGPGGAGRGGAGRGGGQRGGGPDGGVREGGGPDDVENEDGGQREADVTGGSDASDSRADLTDEIKKRIRDAGGKK